MRNLMFGVVLGLLCLAPAGAGAGAPAWAKIDAETLITQCWAISEEDRDSGVTVRMVQGTVDTVACLEEKIVRHATAFFKNRSEEEIWQMVLAISKSYSEFYFVLYNENKGCDPSCGSISQLTFTGALATLLEDILRDLVSLRNFYERDIDQPHDE